MIYIYFLSDNERKKLLKGYLPKSREQGVAEELRGWNWHQPPLEPVYEVLLPLYQIAGKYCDSGRDVFLNKVGKYKGKPNTAMLLGTLFHSLIAFMLVRTKKLIYLYGTNIEMISQELNGALKEFLENSADVYQQLSEASDCQDKDRVTSTAKECLEQLFNYEYYRITSRIQDILSRQPYIGEDSLAAQAVPFILEQNLDGSFLGLSSNLHADAYVFSEPMIIDLKFGTREPFHRLTTTGYALVMEALYDYPINVGCIVYGEFKKGRLYIQKDFHIINDELRQWFIEERDEKMRMVYNEIDPGKATNCDEKCPYFTVCS